MSKLFMELVDGTKYELVHFNEAVGSEFEDDVLRGNNLIAKIYFKLADFNLNLLNVQNSLTPENTKKVKVILEKNDGSTNEVYEYTNLEFLRVNKYFSASDIDGEFEKSYDVIFKYINQ